jgi:hypothetical protein
MSRAAVYSLCVLAIGSWLPATQAQTAITDWSIWDSNGPDTSVDGIHYQNKTYAITGFSTAATSYDLRLTATGVYIRRNLDSSGDGTSGQSGADNSNRSSVWNTQHNSTDRVMGSYENDLADVLLGNNAIMGGDNLFSNSADPTRKNAGNIERLDFYFGAATVGAGEGLTIFDRGLLGEHDSVKIAVFTDWGSLQGVFAPTTYAGNAVTLEASSYGNNLDWDSSAAGVQDSLNYTILRFNNGDNLSTLDEAIETGTQGLAGAFISFADLGIAAGTTIYGYSIMGSDVTGSVSNLADWRNATYYPTGTTDQTGGGIDLLSFNGRIARPVPEPSTYGALLLGGCVGVWFFRRRVQAAKATRV